MGKSLTKAGLALLGVLLASRGLVGGHADQPMDPSDVLRQLGVSDSIAEQWVEPYIPLWALTQEAPVVGPEGPVGAFTSSTTTDCPPSLEISLHAGSIAIRFDEERHMTELYDYGGNGFTTRYDIDSNLDYSTISIPTGYVGITLAVDLDQDGDVEIVSQFWDHLLIHSSPDGTLLADFYWPGLAVEMNPVAVDIDDDPHLEIYVTPHSLGFYARVVVIDYNAVTDSFEKIADMEAPYGAAGYPAVGDFDQDGRMEFISGTFDYGYRLYEWQEDTLVYIGLVGDSLNDMNYNATTCRPKAGGTLYALVGHSDVTSGFYYQLLEPVGDNAFHVAHVFQENTGFTGAPPCWAADTDCDGLDELAMCFHPNYRTWEWDSDCGGFVRGCEWDNTTYGTLSTWRDADLNQDGRREWAAVSNVDIFYSFPTAGCINCDADSLCPAGLVCYCSCEADPVCDSVTNVLDVVVAVDVAFRSGVSDPDPYVQCPVARTDVDCNGYTNVLDVVHFVNVAFRSADPSTQFCKPCS
jgi:hypothetical protein